jgi:hypothetical protein
MTRFGYQKFCNGMFYEQVRRQRGLSDSFVLPRISKRPSFSQPLVKELHKLCDGARVTQRPGRVEVHGDYKEQVVHYLSGLGF